MFLFYHVYSFANLNLIIIIMFICYLYRYEPQGNHRPPSLPISAQHPHLVKPPQHLLPPAVVQSHKINHPLNVSYYSHINI